MSFNNCFDQADGLRFLMDRNERQARKEKVKVLQRKIRQIIITGEHQYVDSLMNSLEQAQLELESTYLS
ncbi:hypothetical protein L4D76_24450 [Photobacterium sagamiensis]